MNLKEKTISELAWIAHKDWSQQGTGVSLFAKPYIGAMMEMTNIADGYGADSGQSVVLYFLSNASTWKGPVARAVKAELKSRIGA